MKQTLEEAAIDFADYELKNLDKLPFGINAKADYDNGLTKGFKAGAEWQAKQSPWISVKERLPEVGELVLCRMVSNGAIVSGFIEPVKGCQPIVSTLPDFEFEDYSDYVCDMWMPIPTFDQILEANKDVLQRMKGEIK
ncbi:hypothetical protein [Bacteroides sp. OM08-17BH]|uniref:hypothetical protein n=1 Tax=Bacteroides sp. OM08-17BH TaxID=2292285 RepID=UPI000E443BC7|nr:hypothetical protein [Bacteroides sp. OM08-17BH]RGM25328.1 hypothetical protein DXC20_15155 [Bacteroides sp. OM08-17BH]